MLSRRELTALMYAARQASAEATVHPDSLSLAEQWSAQMSAAASRGEAGVTLDVTDLVNEPAAALRLQQAKTLLQDFSPDIRQRPDGRWELVLVWAGTSVRVREGKV